MSAKDIINKYKTAWERQDINLLKKIFSDDAVYIEKEDQDPMVGIDAIVDYWEQNSCIQRDVKFQAGPVSFKNGRYEFEWTAEFYRVDLGYWLKLEGWMKLRILDDKIKELSEKFSKKKILGFSSPDDEGNRAI